MPSNFILRYDKYEDGPALWLAKQLKFEYAYAGGFLLVNFDNWNDMIAFRDLVVELYPL